jgi:hypothetical protein
MKYILSVLLVLLFIPSVIFAAVSLPNGGVVITHSNCTQTEYSAVTNSDISRGTTLKNAVAAAVSGDALYLTAGNFDVGTSSITLPTGVSLYGSGIDTTTIISQRIGGSGAILVPGTNSTIGYLTVLGNEGTHQLQLPIGFYQGRDAIPTSFTVEYVKLIAESDGFYLYSTTPFTANIHNSTVESKWDTLTLDSLGSTVNVYDSTFTSVGPYNSAVLGTAAWSRGTGGTLNLYNSTFTASGNVNGSYGIFSNIVNGFVNVYHCTVSGGSYDLGQAGAGTLNIANSNTYTTSTGIITTIPNIVISTPSLPVQTCANPLTTVVTVGGTYNYTITSSSGLNGSIVPASPISLPRGSSQTFAITPNSGYKILDVKVDGASQGPISNYAFSNLMSDHIITATFLEIPKESLIVIPIEPIIVPQIGVITVAEIKKQLISLITQVLMILQNQFAMIVANR